MMEEIVVLDGDDGVLNIDRNLIERQQRALLDGELGEHRVLGVEDARGERGRVILERGDVRQAHRELAQDPGAAEDHEGSRQDVEIKTEARHLGDYNTLAAERPGASKAFVRAV
jgi:thioredoxin-like negative regulator of GroEL